MGRCPLVTPPQINLLSPVSLQEEGLAADALGGGEELLLRLPAHPAYSVHGVKPGGGGRAPQGFKGVIWGYRTVPGPRSCGAWGRVDLPSWGPTVSHGSGRRGCHHRGCEGCRNPEASQDREGHHYGQPHRRKGPGQHPSTSWRQHLTLGGSWECGCCGATLALLWRRGEQTVK